MSGKAVVDTADAALKFIVDLANDPQRGREQTRQMMDDDRQDVIGLFARAGRAELDQYS